MTETRMAYRPLKWKAPNGEAFELIGQQKVRVYRRVRGSLRRVPLAVAKEVVAAINQEEKAKASRRKVHPAPVEGNKQCETD